MALQNPKSVGSNLVERHSHTLMIDFLLLSYCLWVRLQGPVVQTLNSAIHWINHYPLDNSTGFASVYLLDSDLSGGQRYPSFELLGPGCFILSERFTYGDHQHVGHHLCQ